MAKKVIKMKRDQTIEGGLVTWFKNLQKQFLKTKSRVLIVIAIRPTEEGDALDVIVPPYLRTNPKAALRYLELAYQATFAQLSEEDQAEYQAQGQKPA